MCVPSPHLKWQFKSRNFYPSIFQVSTRLFNWKHFNSSLPQYCNHDFIFKKTGLILLNATKHVPYPLPQIYFAWPYMNCLDKSLFSSTFVILKCRCIWVIFPFCFISLRSTASKTKCQHAVDLWLNSWRDTEELPCQSPQGLWRPSVPRQGSLGSKRALNLVILEANGRYQRLYINQGGTWRKTACWNKCQAEGN